MSGFKSGFIAGFMSLVGRPLLLWLLALCLLPSVGAAVPPAAGPPPSIYDAPWRFTTDGGGEVTLGRWRGEILLLAPFYTSCRVRCPLTVDKLRGIDEAYRRAGHTVPVVLVTLDPAHDTPAVLQRFKRSAHLPDSWTLLRGSAGDTRTLGRLLDVRAAGDDAHIDHQVRIAVFDRAGRLARNLHGWDFAATDAVIP